MPEDKASILNLIIQKRGFSSYLEIGVDQHFNFDQIQADFKESIDPNPEANPTYEMTSDEFFEGGHGGFYDLIFIDGLHYGEQVYRDIYNSLSRLARPDSMIILHDMWPKTMLRSRREIDMKNPNEPDKVVWDFDGWWNGDSWLGFVKFRTESNLLTCCLETDEGLGIIDVSKRCVFPNILSDTPYKLVSSCKPEELKYLSWELLNDYRDEILGIISPETFLMDILGFSQEGIDS